MTSEEREAWERRNEASDSQERDSPCRGLDASGLMAWEKTVTAAKGGWVDQQTRGRGFNQREEPAPEELNKSISMLKHIELMWGEGGTLGREGVSMSMSECMSVWVGG